MSTLTKEQLSGITLANDLITNDPAKALAASQGPAIKALLDSVTPLQLADHPRDKYSYPDLVVSGTLTTDGVTPLAVGETLVFDTGLVQWDDSAGANNWVMYHDLTTFAGVKVVYTLSSSSGVSWSGESAWGDWTNIVWTPDGTNTGNPVLTPQITAGLAGQVAIRDDGNVVRRYVNLVSDDADAPQWLPVVDESYLTPKHIGAMTGTLYFDMRDHVNRYGHLTGNTTIYPVHLREGQTFNIRGFQTGGFTLGIDSGNWPFSLIFRRAFLESTYSSLGLVEMSGTLADIAALAVGGRFWVSGVVMNDELNIWVTTKAP